MPRCLEPNLGRTAPSGVVLFYAVSTALADDIDEAPAGVDHLLRRAPLEGELHLW